MCWEAPWTSTSSSGFWIPLICLPSGLLQVSDNGKSKDRLQLKTLPLRSDSDHRGKIRPGNQRQLPSNSGGKKQRALSGTTSSGPCYCKCNGFGYKRQLPNVREFALLCGGIRGRWKRIGKNAPILQIPDQLTFCLLGDHQSPCHWSG